MPGGDGVSLQISVAPRDLPHAREILPHQLRCWGAQVEEVLFTLDLGPGGTRDDAIEELLAGLCERHPGARVVPVDYAPEVAREVSARFFGGRPVPRRDCYGKAVYPYYFALHAARERYVLHVDSDMLFGGGGATWVAEARRVLALDSRTLCCAPFPGPPSERPFPRRVGIGHAGAVPIDDPEIAGPALRFDRMSTRDFLLDRSILADRRVTIPPGRPGPRMLAAATRRGGILRGDPRAVPAEVSLSRAMAAHGLGRIDFLGLPPGMWSLHPASRSAAFLRALPEIVARVERGDVPEEQRGDYDLSPVWWR